MKPQDFDRLSAYIDSQLSPAEKAELEGQLARDAELQAALQELRLTVRALRTLPTVKPPRNFTLSAAQVGAARRSRSTPLFAGLRLAAALSALALVLVVTGDLAGSRGLFGAAATTGGQDATLTTLSATTEAPALAPGPVTPSPEATVAVQSEALLAPTETAPPALGAGSADTSATPGVAAMAGLQPTPTETPGVARQAEPTPSPATKGLTASPTPAPLDMAPPAATPETTDNYAAQPQAPAPGLPPLRLAEAALAMLTVMLGLGAWFARRNA